MLRMLSVKYSEIKNALSFYEVKKQSGKASKVDPDEIQQLRDFFNRLQAPSKDPTWYNPNRSEDYELVESQLKQLAIIATGYCSLSKAKYDDFQAHAATKSLSMIVSALKRIYRDYPSISEKINFDHEMHIEYTDIMSLLKYYDQEKGFFKNLFGSKDPEQIHKLRIYFKSLPLPQASDNNYKLTTEQLNELYYLIAIRKRKVVDREELVSSVFSMLDLLISDRVKEVIEILSQASAIDRQNIILAMAHNDPVKLAKAMVCLERSKPVEIDINIFKLRDNPDQLAEALAYLKTNDLLSETNYKIVIEYAHPLALVNTMVMLKALNVLTPDNVLAISKFINDQYEDCFYRFFIGIEVSQNIIDSFIQYADYLVVAKNAYTKLIHANHCRNSKDIYNATIESIQKLADKNAVLERWKSENPDKCMPAFTDVEIHLRSKEYWKEHHSKIINRIILNHREQRDVDHRPLFATVFRLAKSGNRDALINALTSGQIDYLEDYTLSERLTSIENREALSLILNVNPDFAVYCSAYEGDISRTRDMVETDLYNFALAVEGAARGGHLALCEKLINEALESRKKDDLLIAMIRGLARASDSLLPYMLTERINNIDKISVALEAMVEAAARGGYPTLTIYAYQHGASWYKAVCGAVRGGHAELTNAVMKNTNHLDGELIKALGRKDLNWGYQKLFKFITEIDKKSLRKEFANTLIKATGLNLDVELFIKKVETYRELMSKYHFSYQQLQSFYKTDAQVWYLQGVQLVNEQVLPADIHLSILSYVSGLPREQAKKVFHQFDEHFLHVVSTTLDKKPLSSCKATLFTDAIGKERLEQLNANQALRKRWYG